MGDSMIKLIKEDVGNVRYCVIQRNKDGKYYTQIDWTDSISQAQDYAEEYANADKYQDHEYWAFDTKKWKAYLPTNYSNKDQKFNSNLPIYYLDVDGKAEHLADYVNRVVRSYDKKESIKTEGFGIEDAPGLYKRIYKIISDNHINADIVNTDDSDDHGFVELDVDGDWKHDHLRLKYLLNQAFNTVIWREKENYPSDDDSFRAVYMVYLADPK